MRPEGKHHLQQRSVPGNAWCGLTPDARELAAGLHDKYVTAVFSKYGTMRKGRRNGEVFPKYSLQFEF
jgi:hypothetical protein